MKAVTRKISGEAERADAVRQGGIRGIRECLAVAECLAEPEPGGAQRIVAALREKLARAEAVRHG